MSDVIDPSGEPSRSERERLAALARYHILDTEREVHFDDIVRLATKLFEVPIALVGFLAADRHWLKAEIGLGRRETPIDESVCRQAVGTPGLFMIPDLAADPRFARNPHVACENGLRFYASSRLEAPDGHAIGSVCILDREARPQGLSRVQAEALEALARQVMSHLELRRALVERDGALAAAETIARRYDSLADATRDAIWDWDLETNRISWNEALREAHGHQLDEAEADGGWRERHIHPDDRARVMASLRDAIAGDGLRWAAEYRFLQADGGCADVFDRGSLIRDEIGRARRMVGAMLDLTERNRAAARRSAMAELGERLRDLDDPAAMTFAAAEIMGRTLQVGRAGHASVDAAQETMLVERDWVSGEARSYPGRVHFRDFGDFIDDLKAGETVVVPDVAHDRRTARSAAAMAAIGVCALVNLPVVEQGRLTAIFYLNHASPRSWSDGDLAFIRNVADGTRAAVERARSVAKLRASEELFRVFAQAMPNQVWAADAGGEIDWLNQQVDDYFGQLLERREAVKWSRLVHPDDVEGAAAGWHRAVRTGEVYESEFRLRGLDGGYRWFLARALPIRSETGAIVRWIGTNTDVHEQKLIAAELATANELLSTRVEERTRERDRLWSTTNDLMGTAGIDGRMTSINPAWTRMLGWSEAELLSRSSIEFVDIEDHGEAEDVARRLAAGERIEGLVNRLRAKDGTTRTVMWNAVPDRGVVYFVGRDITDQREAEELLRQALKMEAVGQLTGGIAHDFNNLLTGIIGSLDLLQTRLKQGRTENLDRYLTAATSSANRAAALTHRLLAFARRQPLDPKPVDIAALVSSLEDLLRRTIGEGIGLRIETETGLWPALCDPNQLESAILNLAINARDAMPSGGELTIRTSNTFLDGVSAPLEAGVEAGPFVCVGVTDTGAGMAPETLKRAFDPFFTTKPLGQGTGLGLSMVYGFASQSGGQAGIVSEVGSGTTVSIHLPRHRGDVIDAGAIGGPAVQAIPARHETVLVVEDELMVRDLVVELLSEMGLQVLQAVDGPSGLKVLESPAEIDLLVSDIGLPIMNGRRMADEARRSRPELPVLFITGYAENATLAGLEPGMELMTKPFSADAFTSRVRTMLDG